MIAVRDLRRADAKQIKGEKLMDNSASLEQTSDFCEVLTQRINAYFNDDYLSIKSDWRMALKIAEARRCSRCTMRQAAVSKGFQEFPDISGLDGESGQSCGVLELEGHPVWCGA